MEIKAEIAVIWNNFHRELKYFVENKTRNSADADDILQDAFVRIIKNRDKVNQSQNLRPYLYGIVRNTMFDYLKKQNSVVATSEIPDVFTDEEVQTLNETIAACCLMPFIDKLPEHYREALIMSEFQGVSQKELAEKLGISYSGAKSRVQRGKEKLKALLLECCHYHSDIYGNIFSDKKSCRKCP